MDGTTTSNLLSTSFLCSNCLTKLDHLSHPLVDAGFHHSISSRLRNGFNLSIFSNELAQVNAFLTDVPGSLTGYDKAITEMERLLASLRVAREDLLRRSDNARCLSSAPIRRLPPEILDEIFASYISVEGGGYSLSLRNGRRDNIKYPTLKLSWVCSFWRQCVHARPNHWSSLRLSSQVLHCQPGLFHIFLKHLSFSGDNLLDIHFDAARYDSLLSPRVGKAIDLLLENSMRWRSAVLLITHSSAKDWFSAATRLNNRSGSGLTSPTRINQMGNFSALEYLELPQSLSWQEEWSGFFRTFSHCPQLQTYRGSSFWTGHNADFSHVRELSLTSSVIGKSLGHFLYRLPALESLVVSGFQFSEDGTDDQLLREATHYTSSLSKLTITSRTFQPEAWRFIRLPSLTELQISVVNADHFEDIEHLSSVLLESGCRLQTLRMQIFCFMEPQQQQLLVDFIALHPSLANLVVNLQSDEEVQSFAEHLEPKFATNLRSLELQWNVHLNFTPDELLCSSICGMVKSRCAVRSSSTTGRAQLSGLQALTLILSDADNHDNFSHFIHTHLSDLEKAGLVVDVQSDYV